MSVSEKNLPRCRIFLLDGEKFRTNLLVLFFDLPLKRETTTKTALLAEVLKKNNWQEAAKQAEELYGALWDISVVKKGDRQLLLFSLESLKAVPVGEAVSFLRERIFQPVEKGKFDEKIVERQKKFLKRKLEAMQDGKKAYARKRVSEETAEGTPYALSGDGYAEDLAEINERNLFRWYREILEQAEVKVFFCGERTERAEVLSLRQEFPGRVPVSARKEWEMKRQEPHFLQEHAKLEQARLLMGFSADVENMHRRAAVLLLNELLGGNPDSVLFQKIREEQGLCYDIKSFLNPMSPYLFVEMGIQTKDAKAAGKQVLHCIEDMKEDISEEKLEQAKENILRRYDGLGDDPWAMVDFFAEQTLQGNPLTTEKWMQAIEKAEAEDILRAAKYLTLQTVYLLSGREEDDGEE